MKDCAPAWLLALTVLAFFAFACGVAGAVQNLERPVLTPQEFPRIDGSTSTEPLRALIACRLTRTDFAWGAGPEYSRFLFPTTDPYEPAKRLSLKADGKLQRLKNVHGELLAKIEHHDTHQSYLNLMGRQTQLVLVARKPSEDELVLAQRKGVRIQTVPVALDAFVFIRNKKNPVANITVEQIRAIYTGKLTIWTAMGGPDKPIRPYRREKNSGSEETMEKLVMGGQTMVQARHIEAMIRMTGPYNALRDDELGIGYTFYYYHGYMIRMPEVKMLAVNGVEPTGATVRNRTYPFVTEVYLAHLSDLVPDGAAARVRDWLVSEDGQAVVAESGYAPVKK
jgi:phosphate transport system substrate-binding protein